MFQRCEARHAPWPWRSNSAIVVHERADDWSIVNGTVRMAHELGLKGRSADQDQQLAASG
jgi:hypothetical protein